MKSLSLQMWRRRSCVIKISIEWRSVSRMNQTKLPLIVTSVPHHAGLIPNYSVHSRLASTKRSTKKNDDDGEQRRRSNFHWLVIRIVPHSHSRCISSLSCFGRKKNNVQNLPNHPSSSCATCRPPSTAMACRVAAGQHSRSLQQHVFTGNTISKLF